MNDTYKDLPQLLERAFAQIRNPRNGLPAAAFDFALRIVPMINVDLLVRNDAGEHLLAWREDQYGRGWHVPGGIIRFKEPIRRRIAAVAAQELGCKVRTSSFPADIREFLTPRGHFISLLYVCRLDRKPPPARLCARPSRPKPGELIWIRGAPKSLYSVHAAYSDWLKGRAASAI